MEMTRAETTAVAAVDGMPAELLDAMGRLVITPHAMTVDGQRNVPADLQSGESLAVFLARHVPGIDSGAWVVSIGGAMVPRAMWSRVYPKHGMHIACRAVVAKQVVQLVAIAALSYFTMGMGGFAAGSFMGLTGAVGFVAAMGVFVAGSMLINKVLGPKLPKSGDSPAARQVYSLSGQRNSARAYEPLPVLWGEMRVTPDLASQPYNWFEGDDQYMSTILLGGINVHTVADLAIGDTPIASFSDVSVYHNGFSGMPSVDVPLLSNVDTIPGGELMDTTEWVTRTGSTDTIALGVDLEYQLFHQGDGGFQTAWLTIDVEYRAVGAVDWLPWLAGTRFASSTMDAHRVSFSLGVPRGQYEVRARRREGPNPERTTRQVQWSSLRSIQSDDTDYSQWGRIGIKIKATGQISGSLDTLRATYRSRPLPVWDGLGWATVTTREEGLSNPGAIILQTLRGVYAKDRSGKDVLQWGYGMSDEQIDIEGIKAFMLHCKAKGYTYDRWVTGQMSLQAFCDEVALAGMGQFTWTDGSRPTVSFVANGQPISAVVNMANMKKAGFSVDYTLSNAADGIEYQYLDRNTWETKTLRVTAPGVTTMLNPARVTGEGVTSEAHAAVLARYHLAQSLYQFKTVNFQADIEHLDYRRLSVLSVSHDLTQWGYGGRVLGAEIVGGKIRVQLDEPVPPLPTPHLGLRVPGERDYRVWPMVPMAEASDVVELVGEWPAGVPFPGDDQDNPAHDTLWCADFKATPGYRVRVTSIEPEKDLAGAAVTCVPEGAEFWDYVLNGTYVPAPNGSSIPQLGRPVASNLRAQEQVNLQGDTEWYELHVQWDVEGDYDHAQVWAGRDGSELRLVDGRATGSRATFRIDGAGEWLIEVRPFNPGGQVGRSAALLYITQMADLPPRNPGNFVVQQVAGGMRRFAWAYGGDKPAALAGVQIRYLPGDVPLSTASWDSMQPLGDADDVYTAQFETTRPGAGLWTFGLRAINTAGLLADGIARFVIQLDEVFDNLQEPDLTPPPAVEGLAAVGGMATVMVSWTPASYTVGHGHARTIVYAAQGEGAEFKGAQQVAEAFNGPVSFGSDLGTAWRVWAKHQTVDGVLSWEPAGPVLVQTGQDPSKLKELLDGQIGHDQLDPGLRGEIVDQASSVTELQAQVRGNQYEGELADLLNEWSSRARIRQISEVTAGLDGSLSAKWGVEMELDDRGNQLAGGFSLIGKAEPGQPARIDFGVLANSFYVGAPKGSGIAGVTPFRVQTTPENVNGVVVPAGVFMDAAYISNVTVLWGRFGTLVADTIQATAISAGQLTAGNGVIGGSLKSANYVSGSSGWILRPDGVAEFSGVVVRGTIYATAGTIGGITINANGLNAGAYTGYAWPAGNGTGFHLGPHGLLLGNQSTGKFLELRESGDFVAPGLSIIGGKATFEGQITAGGMRSKDGKMVIDLDAKFFRIEV